MVDTLETSTTWANLDKLYLSVQEGLKNGIGETGVKGLVACHISHIYLDGASLYYTFVAPQNTGKELEQWQIIKNKATDAIVEHQGAISHHHGIGSDHARWLVGEIGETGINILKGIKEKLDPDNIMNPQNLFYE
jgi:alkyldihydroxyacetonephosphate synthase